MIMDDDAEIDDTYTRNIIAAVLDHVSGNEQQEDFGEHEHEDYRLPIKE